MIRLADHIIIAPVVLPLFAGAVMLALGGERHRNVNAAINVVTSLALVAISIALLRSADAGTGGLAGVYRLGDWPTPFAIVFVADRLAALMLLLTSLLAVAAVVFSLARWHRVGVLFHPLFQFLLMGINGAFLTGDLFNLFVFFEVLLAASYGLALHGSGSARVLAGLHYIVVNLAASLLFLIGVSLIYGVAGTLNMADLAARIPAIRVEDRALLEAGAGVLAVAFLVKAGMWPLCFWLTGTYAAAPRLWHVSSQFLRRSVHISCFGYGCFCSEPTQERPPNSEANGCCWAASPPLPSARSAASLHKTWQGSQPSRCLCPRERYSQLLVWGRSV